ncbi:hypothetical protein GH714_002390 [Hevea brasiliensis]|uniref:Uncharacterized protein n=1 Tax=Hevea brasiliensis TaxID=3981 RepID=A0A6A6MKG0_HEVBR|nr:hypothetical protein GH714_002390 [Hevea brasiliensis]
MSQPMQSLRDEQDEDQSIGHEPLQLPVDTQVSPTPLQLGGQVAASSSSSLVRTREIPNKMKDELFGKFQVRYKLPIYIEINSIEYVEFIWWEGCELMDVMIIIEVAFQQGRYMWDETEEQNVRLAWDKLGKDRFRDILNRARNEMLVKHKKSDIAYLHNLGPNWMKAEEDYASAIVEKYGSNSESPPIFDMDKWIEVSGGLIKEGCMVLGLLQNLKQVDHLPLNHAHLLILGHLLSLR